MSLLIAPVPLLHITGLCRPFPGFMVGWLPGGFSHVDALVAGGVEEGREMPGDVSPLSLCALDSVSSRGWDPLTGHLQPGVLGSGDSSSSACLPDLEAVLAASCGWCLSSSQIPLCTFGSAALIPHIKFPPGSSSLCFLVS